ncbi:MAG TPA: class I SAM-dependent methyltransferase [Bacteroidota bacterium]|nr:class I SAM-dependent methyltransferase [Bacteroidota bacterium]
MISRIKNLLRNSLKPEQRDRLLAYQGLHFRWIQHCVFRLLFGKNLRALASVYSTDKWNVHWYAQYYQRHFQPLRRRRLKLLEIGIGGWDNPLRGGGSLRMWRTFFFRSRIYGIDIEDKSPHNERRIRTFRGSQVDEAFLEKVLGEIGEPDIIIDDGSHMNEHVIRSFEFLFPRLREPGIYVIEDTQTAYWPAFGGSSSNLNDRSTSMGYFKKFIDGINYTEFDSPGYTPSYYDQHITSIHFYHNVIFIYKGKNDKSQRV